MTTSQTLMVFRGAEDARDVEFNRVQGLLEQEGILLLEEFRQWLLVEASRSHVKDFYKRHEIQHWHCLEHNPDPVMTTRQGTVVATSREWCRKEDWHLEAVFDLFVSEGVPLAYVNPKLWDMHVDMQPQEARDFLAEHGVCGWTAVKSTMSCTEDFEMPWREDLLTEKARVQASSRIAAYKESRDR